MKPILNEEQKQYVIEKIQDTLLKEGIDVKISISEENGDLKFTSTYFQTIPVLFKKLDIIFNNTITELENKNDKKDIIFCLKLSMNVRCHHFENGRVYVDLGYMEFNFNNKFIRIPKRLEL